MNDDVKQAGACLARILDMPEDSAAKVLRETFISRIDVLTRDAGEETALLAAIEELCESFFNYQTAWLKYLNGQPAAEPDHADAARIKAEAGAITRSYQKVAIQHAQCLLRLRMGMKLLDAAMKKAAAESGTDGGENIEWSYDLPEQIALMIRKRNVLSDYTMKMRRAGPAVARLDSAFTALEKGLSGFLPSAKAKTIVDDYAGELRKHRYDAARGMMKKAAQADGRRFFCFDRRERTKRWTIALDGAAAIAAYIERNAVRLAGRDGGMFFREWEARLAYESMMASLEKARAFLAKYEVAEIKYRRAALDREESKLLTARSFEAFIDLFDALIAGRFASMVTLKDVRDFESGVLVPVQQTIGILSEDIGRTAKRALELRCGPDPESIPDSALFGDIDAAPQKTVRA